MLETELDELLVQLLPSLPNERRGASQTEILRMEAIAGRPLPAFYRWFLETMGLGMGPLKYPTTDFSARRIISAYDNGEVAPDSRFFLIGFETDEESGAHFFYDLDAPARADALVVSRYADGTSVTPLFETFREQLAWTAMGAHRVRRLAQQCRGSFRAANGDVLFELTPIMESLGFVRPVPTGTFCGIFARDTSSAMVCRYKPNDRRTDCQFFHLGGPDAGNLRRILGAVAASSGLTVEIEERGWVPPLA